MGESANINPDLTTVRHEQLFIPLVLKKSTGMFLVVKLGINLFYVFIQNISVFMLPCTSEGFYNLLKLFRVVFRTTVFVKFVKIEV